jgi:hypothetical protein
MPKRDRAQMLSGLDQVIDTMVARLESIENNPTIIKP